MYLFKSQTVVVAVGGWMRIITSSLADATAQKYRGRDAKHILCDIIRSYYFNTYIIYIHT